MGEIPIFTSKAHVFVIDPVTKKSWIPSSKSLVQVNFFFDSSRNTYRIISVEGSKAIINSTIVPDMGFTKTSGKFGQWADLQAGIVYGVGFSSDLLLNKFAEQFDIIREKANALLEDEDSDNEAISFQSIQQPNQTNDEAVCENGDSTTIPSHVEEDQSYLNAAVKKLTLQNEGLKTSVQQNCVEMKRYKNELETLKSTNKKLTTTLQETMQNSSDMHKRLKNVKDENDTLRAKVEKLHSEHTSMERTLEELKEQNDHLLKKSSETSQECNLLQQRIGVLSVVEAQHNECASRIKCYMEENRFLKEEKRVLEEKLVMASEQKRADRSEVRMCCTEIAAQLTRITETTQKLQNSF